MNKKKFHFLKIINVLLLIIIVFIFIYKKNNLIRFNNNKDLIILNSKQINEIEQFTIKNFNSNERIILNPREFFYLYSDNLDENSSNNLLSIPVDQQHLISFLNNYSNKLSVYDYNQNRLNNFSDVDYELNFKIKGEHDITILINKKNLNSRYVNIFFKNSGKYFLTSDIFSDYFSDILKYFSKKELIIESINNIKSINFTDYQSETILHIDDQNNVNDLMNFFYTLQSNQLILFIPESNTKINEIVFKTNDSKSYKYEIYKYINNYYWRLSSDNLQYIKEISEWTYSRIIELFIN